MKVAVLLLLALTLTTSTFSQAAWEAKLDSQVRFYQTTDFGTVLAGTDKSLYAVDGQTGEQIWRVKTGKMSETAVTPVPGTDVILVSHDLGSRSRLEALDVLTGRSLWQSDKVKGDVMQLAADPENDLLAVVLVKDARGKAGDNLKRKPVTHVLRLSDGDELWKRDLDSDIEMMPAKFADGDVDFTLDNYRAPLLIDGRLFLFYEGSTSYDARTGKEKEREKFKINENGLALTEADPIVDDSHVYVSGKGKIRAVDRRTGKQDWEAKDLGITAEMAEVGGILFVRTGGRFTRLKDGDAEEKGPFGVSAIDTANGKTLWRFKGADKGITNFVFADERTIVVADRDDLITLDARTGKRLTKRSHKIDDAQFVVINENGQAVVGGKNEIAAFRVGDEKGREVWRVRHTPPARGVLRIIGAVALRAASIYLRYGGLATSALSAARAGFSLASAANSFRWSGLGTRFGTTDLTTLAGSAARDYVRGRIYAYGSLARDADLYSRYSGISVAIPNARDIQGKVMSRGIGAMTPSRDDVADSIFDRVDPANIADRLSNYLLRRKRIAELRVNYMYFYTDLPRPYGDRGIVGVNVHTGQDARFARVSDPDPQFTVDESAGLLYSANGNKLQAFGILGR